jgi:Tfp pilus tip-associated adhesin PilY1
MVAARKSDIQFRKTTPPGAGQYQVVYGGEVIGTVGRFRLSAGQFGSRWMATTPSRKRSTKFMTRDAAAEWLVTQARA